MPDGNEDCLVYLYLGGLPRHSLLPSLFVYLFIALHSFIQLLSGWQGGGIWEWIFSRSLGSKWMLLKMQKQSVLFLTPLSGGYSWLPLHVLCPERWLASRHKGPLHAPPSHPVLYNPPFSLLQSIDLPPLYPLTTCTPRTPTALKTKVWQKLMCWQNLACPGSEVIQGLIYSQEMWLFMCFAEEVLICGMVRYGVLWKRW